MVMADYAHAVLLYGAGFLFASMLLELSGPAPFKHYLSFGKACATFRQRYLKTEAYKFIATRLMGYISIVVILLGLVLMLLGRA